MFLNVTKLLEQFFQRGSLKNCSEQFFQISQESICAKVSFLVKLQEWVFYPEFGEICQTNFIAQHHKTTVSAFT